MKRLTIASILVTVLIFILEINYQPPYILIVFTSIAFIFLTYYLIGVLQFAHEKITIQTPFSIFLGIEIIAFVSGLLTPGLQSEMMINTSFGMINIILIVYILIMTLQVKNSLLAKPYKFLGTALIIMATIKLIIPFSALASHDIPSYIGYINLADLIPLFAILNIINKTNKILQSDTPELITN
jgi:hypothetical protein